MPKKIKIAVLMGGPSAEHEVSLKSGNNVLHCLDPDKYWAEPILIDKKGGWPFKPAFLKGRVDLAFIAMHGSYGEDGTIQSMLEAINVPYTGSDVMTSAMAMNKFLSLRHFQDVGLTTPQTMFISRNDWFRNAAQILKNINLYFNYPIVVKPNQLGSSIGVRIVPVAGDLPEVMMESFDAVRDLIIQPFIRGREVTCAVLDHGSHHTAYALPPTEIIPVGGSFFNYEAKYDPKGALEITPARLPEPWLREIKRIAIKAHKALGCCGFSRTDMILGDDNKLYVLELNTIPGLTENSLLPKAAEAKGITLSKLMDLIINAGFLSFYNRK